MGSPRTGCERLLRSLHRISSMGTIRAQRVEKELLEGRVRSFQAEVDVLKTEHKSLTTSNKSLTTKNKELEKKHTTADERVKSLEQAAKVKGDAHKKEIEVLTAKWRGVVAGNKALSKSETDLENMIAKMRKELAAVEQKAKDAEAKAFAKVKAQVENLRRLKNEAQARARVAEEAREALGVRGRVRVRADEVREG